MNKLFIVLIYLVIFLPNIVLSETISFKDLVYRNGLYYKKFTDVPFTGKEEVQFSKILSRNQRAGETVVSPLKLRIDLLFKPSLITIETERNKITLAFRVSSSPITNFCLP